MKTYPICLIGLQERQAVVVGGGSIAARKAGSLLEAGAQITVISPAVVPELRSLAEKGLIRLLERAYQAGDLAGAFLAFAATDDPEVNQAVWEEGNRSGCLVNAVDDPAHSNFIMPAVVRRGDMAIAISTGGASPALARRLREWLDTLISPEYGELVELLAELRPDLLARFGPGEERLAVALRLVDSDLLDVIRQEGREAAKRYVLELFDTEPTSS
jgi:siroheme synthase-like protein